jgi:hypothetical protein
MKKDAKGAVKQSLDCAAYDQGWVVVTFFSSFSLLPFLLAASLPSFFYVLPSALRLLSFPLSPFPFPAFSFLLSSMSSLLPYRYSPSRFLLFPSLLSPSFFLLTTMGPPETRHFLCDNMTRYLCTVPPCTLQLPFPEVVKPK